MCAALRGGARPRAPLLFETIRAPLPLAAFGASPAGLSIYKDHQTVTVQEMPENSPPGQLPCSVDLVLEDDLVDQCKPGDRVAVVGVYKAVPVSAKGTTSGTFRTLVVATNVRQLAKEVAQPSFSQEDMKNIRKLVKRKDLFEVVADSLAPSIFGHDQIKKALTLQVRLPPPRALTAHLKLFSGTPVLVQIVFGLPVPLWMGGPFK